IVRCPLLFGRSVHNRVNFTAGIIRKLRAREPVYLFTDEYRTPAWGRDVAALLWQIGASDSSGVFHAGGAERLSRFEMGEIICAALNADRSLLIDSQRKDVNSSADRPRDCSLESSRTNAELSLPGFCERLQQLLSELEKHS
ncbi:MAG: sugar nucleotide-binding protein, partial [Calditrichota bacterium]